MSTGHATTGSGSCIIMVVGSEYGKGAAYADITGAAEATNKNSFNANFQILQQQTNHNER